jgi:hypothetical protein
MLPHATSKDAALRRLLADLVDWRTTQSEEVHIPNTETMWEWLKAEQKAGRMEIPRELQEPGRRGISPER